MSPPLYRSRRSCRTFFPSRDRSLLSFRPCYNTAAGALYFLFGDVVCSILICVTGALLGRVHYVSRGGQSRVNKYIDTYSGYSSFSIISTCDAPPPLCVCFMSSFRDFCDGEAGARRPVIIAGGGGGRSVSDFFLCSFCERLFTQGVCARRAFVHPFSARRRQAGCVYFFGRSRGEGCVWRLNVGEKKEVHTCWGWMGGLLCATPVLAFLFCAGFF